MLKAEILALVEFDTNGGCWLGPTSEKGEYSHWKGVQGGHRASFEAFRGPIPKGLIVRHKCDIKCCINPDHLQLGTHKDNSHDYHRARKVKPAIYDSIVRAERGSVPKHLASAKLFRAELRRLGLSQVGAGRQLKIGDRTIRRYLTGYDAVPKVIRLALLGLEVEGFGQ